MSTRAGRSTGGSRCTAESVRAGRSRADVRQHEPHGQCRAAPFARRHELRRRRAIRHQSNWVCASNMRASGDSASTRAAPCRSPIRSASAFNCGSRRRALHLIAGGRYRRRVICNSATHARNSVVTVNVVYLARLREAFRVASERIAPPPGSARSARYAGGCPLAAAYGRRARAGAGGPHCRQSRPRGPGHADPPR